jgi:4a-hydroxytetrahydrobiopterin dehydratase
MARGTSKLSVTEIGKRAARLAGWVVKKGSLHRELTFESFAQAFGFMTSVAIVAQAMDHHPDWSNSYRRVTIELKSHDINALSERDFDLAEQINELAAPLLG